MKTTSAAKSENRMRWAFAIALTMGLLIAWVDTRPHWNDTGISASVLLLTGISCAFLASKKPWSIALILGIWLPIFNIVIAHNYGAIIALGLAFAGAYIGYSISKMTARQ